MLEPIAEGNLDSKKVRKRTERLAQYRLKVAKAFWWLCVVAQIACVVTVYAVYIFEMMHSASLNTEMIKICSSISMSVTSFAIALSLFARRYAKRIRYCESLLMKLDEFDDLEAPPRPSAPELKTALYPKDF
uniref:Uncharacterized protein n=1 Tax=viral metagenome TaxID=1070528 RepID=A0A2V0RIR9_9ZZZZ